MISCILSSRSYLGMFTDAGVRANTVAGQFAELFTRVEHDIQQWVKAAVESSLGKLGTVGALAVEEFLDKMKSAVQELCQPPVVPAVSDVLPRPPSVAGSIAGVEGFRTGGCSDVPPTEFGERSVLGPSGAPSSSASGVAATSKPGNESHKIMWGGFSGNC